MASDASSTPELTDNAPVSANRSGRKWRYRGAAFLLLAGALYLFRAPLLTVLARPVIVDQHTGDVEWIAPFDGHGHYAQIAQWCQDRPGSRVLLLRLNLSRVEAVNASPRDEVIAQRELRRQGVPDDAVVIVRGAGRALCDWNKARCLGEWLAEHPEARVLLTSNRFASGRKRAILDRVLPAQAAARARLWAIPHPWYDEASWWRRKEGVLDLFNAYLGLVYTGVCGDTSDRWQEFDPDAFDRSLEAAR